MPSRAVMLKSTRVCLHQRNTTLTWVIHTMQAMHMHAEHLQKHAQITQTCNSTLPSSNYKQDNAGALSGAYNQPPTAGVVQGPGL